MLPCQYCNFIGRHKQNLAYHTKVKHKDRINLKKCDKCSYTTLTDSALKRHEIRKHTNQFMKCQFSGCFFDTLLLFAILADLRGGSPTARSSSSLSCGSLLSCAPASRSCSIIAARLRLVHSLCISCCTCRGDLPLILASCVGNRTGLLPFR